MVTYMLNPDNAKIIEKSNEYKEKLKKKYEEKIEKLVQGISPQQGYTKGDYVRGTLGGTYANMNKITFGLGVVAAATAAYLLGGGLLAVILIGAATMIISSLVSGLAQGSIKQAKKTRKEGLHDQIDAISKKIDAKLARFKASEDNIKNISKKFITRS